MLKKLLNSYVNAKVKEETHYQETNNRSTKADDKKFVAASSRAYNRLTKHEAFQAMSMQRSIKYLTILQKIVRAKVNQGTK